MNRWRQKGDLHNKLQPWSTVMVMSCIHWEPADFWVRPGISAIIDVWTSSHIAQYHKSLWMAFKQRRDRKTKWREIKISGSLLYRYGLDLFACIQFSPTFVPLFKRAAPLPLTQKVVERLIRCNVCAKSRQVVRSYLILSARKQWEAS